MSKGGTSTSKRMAKKLQDEAAVMAKIDAMQEPFQRMGKRLHEVIMKAAPELKPRVWYGMPGYAMAKSKPVLLFFRADDNYMTLGLTEKVNLTVEEDAPHQLMECAWFFTDLDKSTEEQISAIVQRAIS